MQDKGVAYAGGGAGVLQDQTKMGLENIGSWETPESVRRDAKIETMDYMFGQKMSVRRGLSTKATGDEFKEPFSL